MAAGDVTVFQEAKAFIIDGGFEAADDIYLALIKDTSTPTAADLTPALTDYNECTAGGNYAAGGQLLDTLGAMVTQSGGTMIFDDTGATASWAKHASNPTDARWALVYNYTQAGKEAICFIDLGATINMTLGDLTITWHANGIFRIV